MNAQEKAAALNALSPISIKMRGVNDWFVDQSTDLRDGHMLIGRFGNGKTPLEAIEDHWRVLVDENEGRPIVARAMCDSRRTVRWNGFIWEDVE